MLFGKNDGMDAEEFWKNRETELGTPVLAKALGRVIRKESTVPLWGLFYTTSRALYFQTFQSDNWLSSIFSGGKRGAGRTKDETIEIAASAMQEFRVIPRKGGFIKIFRQPPVLEVAWTTAAGENQTLQFEIEGDAEALVSSVRREN